MKLNLRRMPAMLAGAVLAILASSCGEQSTSPKGLDRLAPAGATLSGGAPEGCTDILACTGEQTTSAMVGETMKVCKVYPANVTGPAVTIQMTVITSNVTPIGMESGTTTSYTLPANTCMWLWHNAERFAPDQVTLTEIVPAGYTSTSQLTTIVRDGPKVSGVEGPWKIVDGPTVQNSSSATATIGGPFIPGARVIFTNTPIPNTGALGDFVWDDLNANGVQDSGEPGLAGVTVTLNTGATTVTDANGAYSFTQLAPGTYTVTVATPSGYAASPTGAGTTATDNNGSGTTSTINNTLDNSIDFGFYKLGSIGDFVWNDLNANGVQDTGEPGIAGVTVTLTNGSTTTTTTTDVTGAYTFNDLAPGTYMVTVGTPAGFLVSPSNAGGDPTKDSNGSGATVAVVGNSNTTIDFGFYQPGSIGDFVWNDLNANGVQDSGELGIAGATVTLTNGSSTLTTTTGANGAYAFNNLAPGTYTVTVATPSGFLASPSNAGGDPATDSNGSGTTVTVAANSNTTIDFGFYQPGSIGDFVWNDLNANGIQDSGELGIAGATVTLTNGSSTLTTTTDAAGAYAFNNLAPGTYTVTVATPSGFLASPSNAGGDPAKDSNGSGTTVTVAANSNTTIDFGFYQPGSIGDFVWNDLNANGIQDSGELGIAGVTVTLTNGSSTLTTTTGANGAYAFNNLAPGTYTVTVGTPSGFVASPSNAGGDPAKDSNGSGTTVTVAANSNTTIDFGFWNPGSIGNYVWNDLDGDGVQDSGEPGIAGVLVTLSNGATATTDANGLYLFSNLPSGTYTVTVAAPAGFLPSPTGAGTPATDNNGSPATTTIAGNDDLSIDFGFYKPGSLGDFVWHDYDQDGIQDFGEPGIAGVTVTLSNGATTTTDPNGKYTFTNLPPGNYTVTVATPSGFVASPTGAGTQGTDSNGSPASVAVAGNTNDTIDFGFYRPLVFGSCFSVTVIQGVALTPVTVTATGGVPPYTYAATGLPAGITLSSSGTLSGSTLFTGTFSISVKVTDSKGNTATNGTCSLRVTPKATGYTTFTMGGWGSDPSGNNPGQVLLTNWTTVFGTSGVTIGGGKTLKFTSQPAVQVFLPLGGTPRQLTASATNPTTSASGVFGGQILALKLSVEFSNKGILKPGLSALKIATGKWAGMTVAQVLASANAVLGGGALPTGMTVSDINNIVDAINNNFNDGITNNGYLIP